MEDICRPSLPRSLQIKRNRNILSRVIPCVILLAICVVIITIWGEKLFHIPNDDYVAIQKSFYILFLLLPFVITGVPMKLIDTSWSGTISEIKIEESVGTYSRSLGKPGLYTKHDLVLTIVKDDGKKIEYTALSLGQKNKPWQNPPVVGRIEYQAEKYHIGERVHKYYGFKYLYISPYHNNEGKVCIVCGTPNNDQDTVCGLCHSELIM